MRTGDSRLTRIVCWNSATERSVTRRRFGMAALLIRMSTAPNAPSTSRAHSSAAPGSSRSQTQIWEPGA